LFFSEYIEGTSNNKAIELYNPTGGALDLTGYVINYYNNGSATVTKSFDLTGIILAAGDVFVICTDSFASQAECDEVQAWGDTDAVVFYNGDDALELTKNGTVIDVIGVVGEDPGTNWPVGTGATSEYTLRRVAARVSGNTVFTATEWEVLPQDTFDGLGAHTN
jgi:5'-nucleotidase